MKTLKIDSKKLINWMYSYKDDFLILAEKVVESLIYYGEYKINTKDLLKDLEYIPFDIITNKSKLKFTKKEIEEEEVENLSRFKIILKSKK